MYLVTSWDFRMLDKQFSTMPLSLDDFAAFAALDAVMNCIVLKLSSSVPKKINMIAISMIHLSPRKVRSSQTPDCGPTIRGEVSLTLPELSAQVLQCRLLL